MPNPLRSSQFHIPAANIDALIRQTSSPMKVYALYILRSHSPSRHHGANSQTHILWLIAEDFGQHWGAMAQEVRSPNLISSLRGVRYTRFHDRARLLVEPFAFATGMYQTAIDAHHHRSHRDDDYRLLMRPVSRIMRGSIHRKPQNSPEFGFSTAKTD